MTKPQSAVKGNILWTSVDPRWCPSLMYECMRVIYWTSLHVCVFVVCLFFMLTASYLLSLDNLVKRDAIPVNSNPSNFSIIRRKWLTDCRNYLFIFVVLFFRKNKTDVLVSKLLNSWHGLDLNLLNMISKYFFFCLQFSNSSPSRENGLISI